MDRSMDNRRRACGQASILVGLPQRGCTRYLARPAGIRHGGGCGGFAMTQAPANRELAWLRRPDGSIMRPDQIRRAFELRRF